MPIVEEGTNYPTALGRKNVPRFMTRTGPIGGKAMALVRGETPIHLAQKLRAQIGRLPPRGTGLITGTARRGRERGLGRRLTERERMRRHARIYGPTSPLSVESEYETYVHNLNAQLTKYPILPFLDRPHPVLDAIKARAPIVPRVKLLGAFGVVDPKEKLLAVAKNIPRPYARPGTWKAERQIGQLPSAISILMGPSRTVHPSISVEL